MAAGPVVLISSLNGKMPHGEFCVSFNGQIQLLVDLCQHHGMLLVTLNYMTYSEQCRLNINKKRFWWDELFERLSL